MNWKILKHRLMEASPDGSDPGPGAGDSPSSSAEKWSTLADSLDMDYGNDDLGQDASPDPEPVQAAPKSEPVPVKEPAPAAPPTAQQPVAAPPEVVKAPDPAPQAQPAPTQPEQAPTVDLVAQRSTLRNTLVQRYALNEEMAEKALTDPGSVLPELAADLQLNVTEAVTYGIMSTLPQILDQILKQRESTGKSEEAFFGKWKELNSEQGRMAVQHFGQAFRQINPKAPAEEFSEKVGAAAMLSLGLNPQGAAPPSPPAQVPAPPPPAAPGGASPLPGRKAETNKFSILAEELLDDTDD